VISNLGSIPQVQTYRTEDDRIARVRMTYPTPSTQVELHLWPGAQKTCTGVSSMPTRGSLTRSRPPTTTSLFWASSIDRLRTIIPVDRSSASRIATDGRAYR
jgi:hypothetical protein